MRPARQKAPGAEGRLLGHLVGLTLTFRACAAKDVGPFTDTDPDANGWPEAPAGWRTALAAQVPVLARSWSKPEAWQGLTRSAGQAYAVDDIAAEALLGFVSGSPRG